MATPDVISAPREPDRPAAPSPEASTPALTPAQIALVKATVPVLQEHGVAITTVFYKNMLAAHPELKEIFSMSSQESGRQPRALAGAVLAYAAHIDNLPPLSRAVERIAHKHASLGVQAEHYPIVGTYLLGAIGEVLGPAATPAIVDAWTAAYAALAAIFVAREAALYAAHETWSGWRKFRVARRVAEAQGIESFYLAPVDGAPLPGFLPGQYVGLRVFAPQMGHAQSRQYSLSQAPQAEGDCYRISVRRDDSAEPLVPGLISNLLHDSFPAGAEVQLTHPQGEFFVDPADESKHGVPLVLVSAGVGATPLMSILDATTQDRSVYRPISWLHASHSSAVQPFADAVRRIREVDVDRISSRVFLHLVGPQDREGVDYDFGGGRMDLAKVDRDSDLFVGDARAEYYVCGPESFMVDMRQALEDMGVARDRVHLELFAAGDIE